MVLPVRIFFHSPFICYYLLTKTIVIIRKSLALPTDAENGSAIDGNNVAQSVLSNHVRDQVLLGSNASPVLHLDSLYTHHVSEDDGQLWNLMNDDLN